MRWPCVLLVVSTLTAVSPQLGALPPGGSSSGIPSGFPLEAPSCRVPWTTGPASAPRSEVPAHQVATGAPGLLEHPAHLGIGAQRAVIDPTSGRLVVPRRPTLEIPRRRLDSFRVPHAFRPRRLPGGGWKLGLQGRMLTPLFATVGADGKPAPTHSWAPIGGSPEPDADPGGAGVSR